MCSARRVKGSQWILGSILAIATACHFWGIRRDLPYVPDADEPLFVGHAVDMAGTGRLNPGWFGHPGSTVIYPLAAIYHVRNRLAYGGPWGRADPAVKLRFATTPAEFYLLGRTLTISFALLGLLAVYCLGRRVFDEPTALLGTWFALLIPITVSHAQAVRTDSAGLFFVALSLWLCCRVHDEPRTMNQVMAGLVIGLGIGTRYFLVGLIAILLGVNWLVWQRRRDDPWAWRIWALALVGLASVLVGFAVSTPYFFLDHASALQSLRIEARARHAGADGLTPIGNLGWYLTYALPSSLTWPQAVLGAMGCALALSDGAPKPLLLFLFIVVFLGEISLSPLHWERWIIQILPILSLFAAHPLVRLARLARERLALRPTTMMITVVLGLAASSAWPVYRLAVLAIQHGGPSTRIVAREWVLGNLPAGSRIAQDTYSAPLDRTGFYVIEHFSLSQKHTLQDYRRDGFQYLMVSSAVYERFLGEDERHPIQAAFYRELFETERLVAEFVPSTSRGGPVIRVYQLRVPDDR